jgi:hypothetical protein
MGLPARNDMKNQTAVEWLVDQYTEGNYSWEVYQHAKEKEKHQISMAHLEGAMKMHNKEYQSGDQYYKENYGDK